MGSANPWSCAVSGVEVHVRNEQVPRWIQAPHAAFGWALIMIWVFALTHVAAALSRVRYMAVTEPSWWCFRPGWCVHNRESRSRVDDSGQVYSVQ